MSDQAPTDPNTPATEPGTGAPAAEATEQVMPTSPFGKLPEGDEEWVVAGDIRSAPEWVDRNWAAFDQGAPAIAVPNVLDQGSPPYTTTYAHEGDTIRYKAGKDGKPGKFTVEPKPAEEETAPAEGAPA